jgi:membrane protease YdiL (CAAX protease family)
MPPESKTFPVVPSARCRYVIWSQIAIAFLFLELAIWAPTTALRNRWGSIAMITIVVLVLSDVLIDRRSLKRLGLGLPKAFGATMALGIGLATVAVMVILVHWLGGQIPANPAWWPNLRLAWGYVLWALIQEFMLQSFFFNRFEDLYGSSAAVWMASTIFAAAHLPSPILTTATLIGALFFCEIFRRYRSIYPLAIVHATLGLTIALLTPASLLHHMRVGIGYLRY